MKQFIIIFVLLQNFLIFSMEQLQEDKCVSKPTPFMVLISNTNKEYVVNEEAIRNSDILHRHKACNRDKLPLLYSDEIVGFLAQIFNDPLHQEALWQVKIQELQNKNNVTGSLAEYSAALKEFGISINNAIDEMPHRPVTMQMIVISEDEPGNVEVQEAITISQNQRQEVFVVNQSCCRNWQCHNCESMKVNGLNGRVRRNTIICSFSVVNKFRDFVCCLCPFFCYEIDGRCYVNCCMDA